MVLLGPPNRGAPAARAWAYLIGSLCPVLHELSDEKGSLVNRLPAIQQMEIGIIAARNDRVIAEASTHLDEEKDHRIVACGHIRLLIHAEVAEQVCQFLREGQFR